MNKEEYEYTIKKFYDGATYHKQQEDKYKKALLDIKEYIEKHNWHIDYFKEINDLLDIVNKALGDDK